jgi:hypothetical protein
MMKVELYCFVVIESDGSVESYNRTRRGGSSVFSGCFGLDLRPLTLEP